MVICCSRVDILEHGDEHGLNYNAQVALVYEYLADAKPANFSIKFLPELSGFVVVSSLSQNSGDLQSTE